MVADYFKLMLAGAEKTRTARLTVNAACRFLGATPESPTAHKAYSIDGSFFT